MNWTSLTNDDLEDFDVKGLDALVQKATEFDAATTSVRFWNFDNELMKSSTVAELGEGKWFGHILWFEYDDVSAEICVIGS